MNKITCCAQCLGRTYDLGGTTYICNNMACVCHWEKATTQGVDSKGECCVECYAHIRSLKDQGVFIKICGDENCNCHKKAKTVGQCENCAKLRESKTCTICAECFTKMKWRDNLHLSIRFGLNRQPLPSVITDAIDAAYLQGLEDGKDQYGK